tara:strand:- start:165 stop:620 length:456 start_codon:yes stop_codon:yes gene_type:complete
MQFCYNKNEIDNKTSENTSFLSFNNKTYTAKIVYIYDGDSMHVIFKEFNQYFKWKCRINGVDTPEIKTKNKKEKEFAIKIRDNLKEKLLNQILTIKCFEFDKYGRLLIDIIIPKQITHLKNEIMLSDWLIQNNYAYKYGGGTKQNWEHLYA